MPTAVPAAERGSDMLRIERFDLESERFGREGSSKKQSQTRLSAAIRQMLLGSYLVRLGE